MKILLICLAMFFANSFPDNDCTLKGYKLSGKVRVVTSGEDLKVRVVDSFEDLLVQKVDYDSWRCGQWQFVSSGEDLKIRFVSSGEDLKIRYVDYLPYPHENYKGSTKK